MIKVATVIVFIIISLLMILVFLGGQAPVGFTNFFVSDGPFHGGFLATFGIFLAAGFSFQGTELLGITRGGGLVKQMILVKIFRRLLNLYFGVFFFLYFSDWCNWDV